MSRHRPLTALRLACVFLSLYALSVVAATGGIANRFEQIDAKAVQGRVEIRLRTTLPPTFQSFTRQSPAILIVDLINTEGNHASIPAPSDLVEEISVEARNDGSTPTTRLWVRMKTATTYDVEATNSEVRVVIFEEERTPSATAQVEAEDVRSFVTSSKAAKVAMRETRRPEDVRSDAWVETSPRFAQFDVEDESLEASTDEEEALSEIDPTDEAPGRMQMNAAQGSMGMSTGAPLNGEIAMTYIGFVNRANESEVFARLNRRTGFEVRREGDNLMVLEIPRAVIPLRNNKNHLDTTFFESPVKMITPTVVDDDEPMIRIIIEMKDEVPYESNFQGNDVIIRFKR